MVFVFIGHSGDDTFSSSVDSGVALGSAVGFIYKTTPTVQTHHCTQKSNKKKTIKLK